MDTDYPFADTVRMEIQSDNAVRFPLSFRIPAWADLPVVKVNSGLVSAEPGTFKTIEREWKNGDVIEIMFPMKVNVERRFRNSVALTRGPIVYSLKIGERWERIRGEDPCPDYAVYPTTPWNYGLLMDPEHPEVEIVEKGIGDFIFDADSAPIELRVKGKQIPEWGIEDNQAGLIPESPVFSNEPVEDLTLIPYGCAKLRITEFPLVSEDQG